MSETLPTVPFRGTDMQITRVGFGAWAIGGGGWAFGWGEQDDAASVTAIRHAVEAGVNWIDTAAVYGLGHSEEVVARALKDLPEADRPYVFTKGGRRWDDADRYLRLRSSGAEASLRYEVEASLTRLGVERIDLYQMHWPADDGTSVEDYWGGFLHLMAAGKLRAAGTERPRAACPQPGGRGRPPSSPRRSCRRRPASASGRGRCARRRAWSARPRPRTAGSPRRRSCAGAGNGRRRPSAGRPW